MKIDLEAVEETAKLLYIRALKVLPGDIKEGFQRLDAAAFARGDSRGAH